MTLLTFFAFLNKTQAIVQMVHINENYGLCHSLRMESMANQYCYPVNHFPDKRLFQYALLRENKNNPTKQDIFQKPV
jgi:hypothetical protein